MLIFINRHNSSELDFFQFFGRRKNESKYVEGGRKWWQVDSIACTNFDGIEMGLGLILVLQAYWWASATWDLSIYARIAGREINYLFQSVLMPVLSAKKKTTHTHIHGRVPVLSGRPHTVVLHDGVQCGFGMNARRCAAFLDRKSNSSQERCKTARKRLIWTINTEGNRIKIVYIVGGKVIQAISSPKALPLEHPFAYITILFIQLMDILNGILSIFVYEKRERERKIMTYFRFAK